MGVFKLGKMTFGSLFKKPETTLYPLEKKPQPLGLKGHIVLDAENCILCGMCEKGCPTDCITVDKATRTWSVQPCQCVQCGYCTQVCPKNCLTMDPNYWTASTAKDITTVTVPEKEKTASASASAAKSTQNDAAASKASQDDKATAQAKQEPAGQDAAQAQQKTALGKEEASTDSQAVEKSAAFDPELEAKLAIMDADKAERVRKALSNR